MARSILSILLVASAAQAFLPPAGRCATVRIGKAMIPTLSSSSSSLSTLSQNVAEVPTKDINEIDNPLTLELDPKKEDEKFNWFKSWYPVVPVEILDPEVPHKFQLLGMDIVVWNDAPIEGGLFGSKKKRAKSAKRVGGQWRAFIDACPHRKVPLSEGRVEDDGSLLCSYHAWRFDGQGALVNIPQLETDVDLERIKSNPKSNCNAFPTQVVDGLLWVWPDSGEDARLESALKEPPTCKIPQGVSRDKVWTGPWNFRELPYGADFFLENVVDPAHVEVR
jgi:nitrite reductase/ring-hydroxylating ferredoxin subunit